MPIYDYVCPNGHHHEEFQSIKSFDKNRITSCPDCGLQMETYIGTPPLVILHNITTIGQQGEKNWKDLGKVRQEEKLGKNKEAKEKAEKELLKEKGFDGTSLPDYKRARKLASLNKDQKKRYIQTGKLPP